MKTILFLPLAVGLNCLCMPTESARILSVTFFASKSFRNAFDPLHFELAQRGHNLTIVNPIPPTKTHPNIREINLPTKQASPLEASKFAAFFKRRQMKEVVNIMLVGPQIVQACHQFLQMEEIQNLIKEDKFDLIFAVGIGNECSFGYIHQFKTPFIILSPITSAFHVSAMSGVPAPVSFVPSLFSDLGDQMTLLDRINNMLISAWYTVHFHTVYAPQMDAVNREYFGPDTPHVMDIAKNMSLMLVNSHFSTNYLRPVMPDIVDIGGLHCEPAKSLPKDILDFLSDAHDGFIYFSMGSILKGSLMPEELRQTFVSVFRKLKQKVLWKWETEEMVDKPDNVKLMTWAPQLDILGHPKIRLFITHAGGLSTNEAIFNGVPILGIPMFGDQDYNINLAEHKHCGLKLELSDISEETLMNSIQKILTEPKYSKTAKSLSGIFRDRQNSAMETAVYWIEYVIRHNGATHLRSPARDLSFVQYYSLDVIAILLAAFALAVYLLVLTTKSILYFVFSSSKKKRD